MLIAAFMILPADYFRCRLFDAFQLLLSLYCIATVYARLMLMPSLIAAASCRFG